MYLDDVADGLEAPYDAVVLALALDLDCHVEVRGDVFHRLQLCRYDRHFLLGDGVGDVGQKVSSVMCEYADLDLITVLVLALFPVYVDEARCLFGFFGGIARAL